LDKLFTPYVREAYRIVREQHGLSPVGSNNELDAAIAGVGGHAPPTPPPENRRAFSNSATVGHLGLFNQRLQQHSKPIEWVFDDTVTESTNATPYWVAKAMVDGQCWGVGHGNNKKAAKNEAAKQGLRRMGYEEVCSMLVMGLDTKSDMRGTGQLAWVCRRAQEACHDPWNPSCSCVEIQALCSAVTSE
jgi:ribonuclease III